MPLLEVVMKVLAALGLAVALSGCQSPGVEPEPGAIVSRCGRFTLRLGTIEWRKYNEKQVRPALAVHASVEGLGPDLPLLHAVTRWRTLPDERRSPLSVGSGFVEGPPGVFLMNFESMEGPLVLKRVQVDCRILRVLAWTEHTFGGLGEGASGPFSAPPYSLGVHGEEGRVRTTSGTEEGLSPGVFGVADGGFLGPVWAGRNARVTDAAGRALVRTLPQENWMADHAPESGPVAYPVRVDLRVPERYFVETVTFDIEEIVVPPVPGDLPVR